MKEHPILFSTPMVQAILEGRKTQTRRIAKVPVFDHYGTDIMDWPLSERPYEKEGQWFYKIQTDVDDYTEKILKCRYGKVGDVLWVRETCCAHEQPDGKDGVLYKADAGFVEIQNTKEAVDRWMDLRHYGKGQYKDVPSIHMPKWAARIFIEIINIRVERLQDISDGDAIAEGVESNECKNKNECISELCKKEGCSGIGQYYQYSNPMNFDLEPCYSAVESYKSLWESINEFDSWKANPWVWVVEFKKINQSI